MSLVEKIKKSSEKARFHTPGHSGKINQLDVTELSYSDNLLHPQGDIAVLEKKIASVYQAEACFISTQGATTSLWEAIFATKDRGDFLLIGNVHSSVYNAMRAFSLRAYHVDQWKEGMRLSLSIKTAIVTSPDYFGKCLPLQTICEDLHKRDVAVICDAAHGSHFVFSDRLPPSASLFADLTVHSLHKTLPVTTGGSVLLTRDEKLTERCALARKILHGTSPSYITLSSIEDTFSAENELRNGYEKVLFHVKQFCDGIKKPFYVVANDDPARLVLASPFSGSDVSAALEKVGFVAEMSADSRVVFIVTPYNYDRLPDLQKAINALDTAVFAPYKADDFIYTKHAEPTLLTFGGEWEEVPLFEAKNRKLYLEVGLYPPGVPLAYSHDILTPEMIDVLAAHPNSRFGMNGDNVFVLKE